MWRISTFAVPSRLVENLGLDRIPRRGAGDGAEAEAYYRAAAERTADAEVRQLLGDLAAEEVRHERGVAALEAELAASGAASEERLAARRRVRPHLGAALAWPG